MSRASAPRRATSLAALAVAALAALSPAAGCRPRASGPTTRQLDEATIAVLTTARALHHEADVYESAGDFANATRAVERVLTLRFPRGMEEAEEVRADAYGRLGEIAIAADDPEAALAHANTGMRDSRRESVLRARLFVVRGRALRMLAERAQAAGDTTSAESRRREAIDAFETAIQIDQRVLGRLLDGGVR